ncbi:unnamed protein product [Pylaiella littoralis]
MELRASTGSSAAAKACLVAGRYASVTLTEIVDQTAAEVVLQLGAAPAAGDVKGADAVLRHIGGLDTSASSIAGSGDAEKALVEEWIQFASTMQASGAATSMAALESRLEAETFLAGQRVTLADVAVCCKMIGQGEGLPPAVARWMGTCLNQPHFNSTSPPTLKQMRTNERTLSLCMMCNRVFLSVPSLDSKDFASCCSCIPFFGQAACDHEKRPLSDDTPTNTHTRTCSNNNDNETKNRRAVLDSNGSAAAAPVAAVGSPVYSEPTLLDAFEDGNKALDKLKELEIEGALFEHQAATTVQEQLKALGSVTGVKTKNLFLKDKKAGLFLVTVRHDRPTDVKTLAKLLNLPGKVTLRFADAATLDSTLGVAQGAVSPLALVNDTENVATLAMDKALIDAEEVVVHPLRNDRSVRLKAGDLVKFVTACGHEPTVLDFSKVKEAPPDPESVRNAATVKIDPNAAKKSVEKAKEAAKKVKHGRSDPNSKAGMKKETLLAMTASKFDDFPTWYREVITLSEMIDYYDISGCYILRPWAYQIWEAIQQWMNKEIKELDVQNSYFPLFVSRKALEAEKAHVEGFAAEVAWVTKSGEDDLEEPIAVRPTSETIMYPAFARWIRSHRDLPLKLNQWSNVVRWEFKNPTPFLRTREFLWQEGHTAHASFEDADKMVMQALDLYRRVYEELLAVPVIMGTKTEAEKFAGGHKTTTVEAYISGTGRAIQGATSHHLGQNFGKMFKIQYEDDKGELAIPWQTSWGLTTRTLGVCVMCHGDDQGLVLPPRVAPLQAVIIPIVTKKVRLDTIAEFVDPIVAKLKAAGVRVKCDDRINYTAGWKYNHWEQKGVPIRLEVGPRDLESKQTVMARRDTGEKMTVAEGDITSKVLELLETIQANLLARLTAERDDHFTRVTEWAEFVPALNRQVWTAVSCLNDIVLTPFCNETEWEEKVKKLSRAEALKEGEVELETTATSVAAKTLCIPLDQPDLPEGTPCFISGKPATCWVLWGRSY